MDIRILGGRVISPDGYPGDIGGCCAGFVRQLADGAIVVQTRHCRKLSRVDIRRVCRGNQCIGIRRISNDQYLNISRGDLIQRLALHREYSGILGQQVLALHSRPPGTGTYQHSEIDIRKYNGRIIRRHYAVKQWECTVIKLHDNALKGAHRRRDFEQLQNDRLVASQHIARSNPEQHGVTDLSGRTCDRNPHRFLHEPLSFFLSPKFLSPEKSINVRQQRDLAARACIPLNRLPRAKVATR